MRTLWIGFFKDNNTFINISDFNGFDSPYDISVKIDNDVVIQDIVDTIDYSYFGKIHPTRITIGRHIIIVKSDSLNICDSLKFYSIFYTKFYIEINKDRPNNQPFISIDKRLGRKFIFE